MENGRTGSAAQLAIRKDWGRKKRYLKRYWTLYLLLLLPVVFFVIFRYVPMAYILGAFKQNNILLPPWDVPWAKNDGFEFFIKAFKNRDFLYALRNTVMLNVLDLVIGFPAPILLALLLNELTFKRFKRITQTVVYLPHFLSWIIISGLALRLLAPNDGLVNILLNRIGIESIPFLNDNSHWVGTYVVLGIWKDRPAGTPSSIWRRSPPSTPTVRGRRGGRRKPLAQNMAYHAAGPAAHDHRC
jgi:putative aldouronate transport system permease protein